MRKKKRPKKNPTDPFRLAREVVEAAIGEALTPKTTKARPKRKLRKKRQRQVSG